MHPPLERTATLLTVDVLLEGLLGRPVHASERVITGAAIDSRQVNPGSLFVALPGERHDGHEFVADAFQRGALLALVDRKLGSEIPVVDLRRKTAELPELELPCALRVKDT
ncbi:MAG TPA: Mur ligase domain-containing protein, partial [Anaerolineales bacterium]|nr:Mur ligase domain-containing protein [Anaerolineales bacterium]